MVFIAGIVSRGSVQQHDIDKYRVNILDKGFFYSKEIKDYLYMIHNKGLRLLTLDKIIASEIDDVKRNQLQDEKDEMQKWFFEQISVASELFTYYLTILPETNLIRRVKKCMRKDRELRSLLKPFKWIYHKIINKK